MADQMYRRGLEVLREMVLVFMEGVDDPEVRLKYLKSLDEVESKLLAYHLARLEETPPLKLVE